MTGHDRSSASLYKMLVLLLLHFCTLTRVNLMIKTELVYVLAAVPGIPIRLLVPLLDQ